jgi:hypothetical protein
VSLKINPLEDRFVKNGMILFAHVIVSKSWIPELVLNVTVKRICPEGRTGCDTVGFRARDETEEGQLWDAETDGKVLLLVLEQGMKLKRDSFGTQTDGKVFLLWDPHEVQEE